MIQTIDFSTNDSIHIYGKIAAERNIKIISAISHYNKEDIHLLQELSKVIAVFWSSNITLGINYLMFAAKILKTGLYTSGDWSGSEPQTYKRSLVFGLGR